MKNLNVTANYVLVLLISGFVFTACTSNESTDLETQEFDATEVVLSAEIDEATAKENLKASAKAKLIAGQALTEDEANTIVL